jgi:hypothetical protein
MVTAAEDLTILSDASRVQSGQNPAAKTLQRSALDTAAFRGMHHPNRHAQRDGHG